jgi:single-strand DNA-binding protein
MAYHKLTVIGKLVSDPKFKGFDNGGGVAKFGLPIDFTRRKKNPTTGLWEGESFIIDVDVFNRDNYKLADIVMQSLKKGSQVYVEGRLKPNEYTDKNGTKVFKPVLVADVVEFLDPRPEGMGGGMPASMSGGMGDASARPSGAARPAAPAGAPARKPVVPAYGEDDYGSNGSDVPPAHGGSEDDIPF